MKLYRVDLSEQERATLLALIQKGKAAARKVRRAHVLLLAAEDKTDRQIAAALHTGTATVELSEKPRPGAKRKLDGKQAALVVALTCSAPPEGRRSWTMQLLADRLVELGVVEAVSDETVRRLLKQTRSNRGSSGAGVCPR